MSYFDAAYAAIGAFFALLVIELRAQEPEICHAVGFVSAWSIGLMIFRRLAWSRLHFVVVGVVLEIILILKIFGRDIRISSAEQPDWNRNYWSTLPASAIGSSLSVSAWTDKSPAAPKPYWCRNVRFVQGL